MLMCTERCVLVKNVYKWTKYMLVIRAGEKKDSTCSGIFPMRHIYIYIYI